MQERSLIEQEFGRRVRAEREKRGWTQERLSSALGHPSRASTGLWVGLHPTAITRMERGERGVSLHEALAIANLLGLPLEELANVERTTDARIRELEETANGLSEHINALARQRNAVLEEMQTLTDTRPAKAARKRKAAPRGVNSETS